jgi:rRNA biogenesis protein RRP5
VLVVDPDRNRVSLTAKKTLLDSTLPIISKSEDVKAGMVTHAVVFRTYEKHIVVEFYNKIKATIPHRETG